MLNAPPATHPLQGLRAHPLLYGALIPAPAQLPTPPSGLEAAAEARRRLQRLAEQLLEELNLLRRVEELSSLGIPLEQLMPRGGLNDTCDALDERLHSVQFGGRLAGESLPACAVPFLHGAWGALPESIAVLAGRLMEATGGRAAAVKYVGTASCPALGGPCHVHPTASAAQHLHDLHPVADGALEALLVCVSFPCTPNGSSHCFPRQTM